MRNVTLETIVAGLFSTLAVLGAHDVAARSDVIRLGIKAVGYFWAGAAGAVGYGVAESAGGDIYQSGKKALIGEQKKQLKPPQRKVYELSDKYWRTHTSSKHCIELTPGQCSPCDLVDKTCNLRAEKTIIFSEHQVK